MEEYIEIIKKSPLFKDIEEENILKMLGCLGARVLEFDKKYTVFSEGSGAKHLGIVLSGCVQINRIDYYGNRSILSEVRAPQMFAEAFACSDVEIMPVSVIATEPSVIMIIEVSHILHTCSNVCDFHQKLIFNLMKDLAEKTIQFHKRSEIISKRTTREKLLAYLYLESGGTKHKSFDIPFDRQELADYLEVERSGLSAEISKLRREGVIESEKNRFKLL